MLELHRVMERGERLLWKGKPAFWPFVLAGFLGPSFTLVAVLVGLLLVARGLVSGAGPFAVASELGLGVALVACGIAYRGLVHRHTYYGITNRRVIAQGGLVGREFETVDFDKMAGAEVNVGVADKAFGKGSGSIVAESAGGFCTLRNVRRPYEVLRFLKKASFDVKTDIAFTNKYRPRENPGYRSRY